MDEESVPIALKVLRDMYAYEIGKPNPDPVQVESIGNVISQLSAIHRIWLS